MAGTALNDFADFVAATSSTYVSGSKNITNLAGKAKYWFGRFLSGSSASKRTLRGGKTIKNACFWQDNGTAEFYQPGQSHDWQNPQRLDEVEVQWRFMIAHMSWVEQEILLNDVITHGTEDAVFAQFVDIRTEKEALMWTSKWNKMESALWAEPDPAKMEGNTVAHTDPYSIFAFVNENADGLFMNDGDTASSGFTTIEGIDPTAATVDGQFTPQQVTYGSNVAGDPDSLVSRLDDLHQKVEWDSPPTHKEYFENDNYSKQIAVTSTRGVSIIKNELRNQQDSFPIGNQDPGYPNPQVYGVPITRASELDTATVFPGASDAVTEFNATNAGPRVLLLNTRDLYPVFHSEMYFEKKEVTKHHNVPDTWVCPVATWYNFICTNRKTQGILYPSADVYTS